ncbi:MAG: ATP-binding cassette domain-containing protein [Myxococcota bacterium]|nr:ABC transporter ATP-binding protein [Deltaproteobacteria bacterium]MCP4242625.1 ATP-binding cassette domain-containing protein [bacterium]MDP6074298.1 ATP-binding cassette domain-containing protein [Myxococcota bacterium]MDP6243526.1 ATP-binding cassette domain-containing protein [Myxococcota bacterium]MDP7073684.1 ATP-binding cassette domain-containing protein [Myxococcota bacterium]
MEDHAEAVEEFRIALDGVRLSLGGRPVFRGLSCGFMRGQITVILGESGSGKSTLLRLIAGLTRPDSGAVRVAGQDVARLGHADLYRLRDRIGMLFQYGALLDSMTIADNVALPLREHTERTEADVVAEVERRLAAVGLPDAGPLYPRELSGGMSRRAALARALVTDPEIVLCDEPFSGLDPLNLRRIEKLLVDLNRRLGLTMLVTSHHLASSMRMAHRIVFLTEGRAVAGTPKDLVHSSERAIVEFLDADSGDEGPAGGSGA